MRVCAWRIYAFCTNWLHVSKASSASFVSASKVISSFFTSFLIVRGKILNSFASSAVKTNVPDLCHLKPFIQEIPKDQQVLSSWTPASSPGGTGESTRRSLCYVEFRVDTSPHFFIAWNHKVFTMWLVKKLHVVKMQIHVY